MARKGFAAMDKERVRELGRIGGRKAVNRHAWTTEEAQVAGRKGGTISRRKAKEAKHE